MQETNVVMLQITVVLNPGHKVPQKINICSTKMNHSALKRLQIKKPYKNTSNEQPFPKPIAPAVAECKQVNWES